MAALRFPGWDPVFLDLWGPLDLRYYGLMYIVGFVAGLFILKRLARRRFLPIPEEAVVDLLFYLIVGVILGGRLGYSLFYKPEILSDPFQLLRVWEGGMSFHGGLLGVVVAFILFSRKHKLPAWRLCDSMAFAVCPGLFSVRLANFINGELYGRIIPPEQAGAWPWAMRFPSDPVAVLIGNDEGRDIQAIHRPGLKGLNHQARVPTLIIEHGHVAGQSHRDRAHTRYRGHQPRGGIEFLGGVTDQLKQGRRAHSVAPYPIASERI